MLNTDTSSYVYSVPLYHCKAFGTKDTCVWRSGLYPIAYSHTPSTVNHSVCIRDKLTQLDRCQPQTHPRVHFHPATEDQRKQTPDHWKQLLLKETGSVAPFWTACVLAGEIPTLSSPSRPREPLKPSEPSIMEERKREMRTAMALQLQVPEDAVPETSSMLVWERYMP